MRLRQLVSDSAEAEIVDQHVQKLNVDDTPYIVAILVYITNAYRAYKIVDAYRAKGVFVILGGLHVTSLPEEAEHTPMSFFSVRQRNHPQGFSMIFARTNTAKVFSQS